MNFLDPLSQEYHSPLNFDPNTLSNPHETDNSVDSSTSKKNIALLQKNFLQEMNKAENSLACSRKRKMTPQNNGTSKTDFARESISRETKSLVDSKPSKT